MINTAETHTLKNNDFFLHLDKTSTYIYYQNCKVLWEPSEKFQIGKEILNNQLLPDFTIELLSEKYLGYSCWKSKILITSLTGKSIYLECSSWK